MGDIMNILVILLAIWVDGGVVVCSETVSTFVSMKECGDLRDHLLTSDQFKAREDYTKINLGCITVKIPASA